MNKPFPNQKCLHTPLQCVIEEAKLVFRSPKLAVIQCSLTEAIKRPLVESATLLSERTNKASPSYLPHLLGRACAVTALLELGMPLEAIAPIGNETSGLPLFPQFYSGSISHTKDSACAVVIQGSGKRIGIDIERTDRTLSDAAIKKVSQTAEGIPFPDTADLQPIVIASLKESAYKAWYPDVRRYFGFSAAGVALHHKSGRPFLAITAREDLSEHIRKGNGLEATVFSKETHNISIAAPDLSAYLSATY